MDRAEWVSVWIVEVAMVRQPRMVTMKAHHIKDVRLLGMLKFGVSLSQDALALRAIYNIHIALLAAIFILISLTSFLDCVSHCHLEISPLSPQKEQPFGWTLNRPMQVVQTA